MSRPHRLAAGEEVECIQNSRNLSDLERKERRSLGADASLIDRMLASPHEAESQDGQAEWQYH